MRIGGQVGEFSITHILLISAIALIFFGPSRLPALGQALGRSINSFKKGMSEITDEKSVMQIEPINNNNRVQANVEQTSSTQSCVQRVREEQDQKV